MQVLIAENHEEQSFQAAMRMVDVFRTKPDPVFCVASGDSPRLAYGLFVPLLLHSGIDFSRATFIGLDEWIGVMPDNPGSCHYFLRRYLFDPLGLSPEQFRLFDAQADDLTAECRAMDAFIAEKGGIDFMLVGIGMNGHIGFNEPGTDPGLRSHVVSLDATTTSVGQKYFAEKTSLKTGITLGLTQLAEARKAVLVASGARKAPIVQAALEGPVSTEVPASFLRRHSDATILLDREAGSQLKKGL
ncbi:6-phosphogluconolactonase [Siphonobacter aquaeclarae]|uniref:Galactosamine-6-phosphate isomerase n=1 Tax=Siphonobacter aquaeclarae TaxID=563176 RepID=A0A1G9REV7_9BACT|nr:glucosamine-6-phosphate deaminase [Siphonobacter aquaeclarae]SDM21798.1 galactosamine-6-phosphate isomerase [Siphonobacter aquaeclarae]